MSSKQRRLRRELKHLKLTRKDFKMWRQVRRETRGWGIWPPRKFQNIT